MTFTCCSDKDAFSMLALLCTSFDSNVTHTSWNFWCYAILQLNMQSAMYRACGAMPLLALSLTSDGLSLSFSVRRVLCAWSGTEPLLPSSPVPWMGWSACGMPNLGSVFESGQDTWKRFWILLSLSELTESHPVVELL